MATYNTPGVWVEEISTLPPSVAGVATAIPAFIGYTEKGGRAAATKAAADVAVAPAAADVADATAATAKAALDIAYTTARAASETAASNAKAAQAAADAATPDAKAAAAAKAVVAKATADVEAAKAAAAKADVDLAAATAKAAQAAADAADRAAATAATAEVAADAAVAITKAAQETADGADPDSKAALDIAHTTAKAASDAAVANATAAQAVAAQAVADAAVAKGKAAAVAAVANAKAAADGAVANAAAVPVVKRIDTLLDYQTFFGGPPPSQFVVALAGSGAEISSVQRTPRADGEYLLYYSLSHYFANGGGSCYVISVGDYTSKKSVTDFVAGLDALEKEDEPTLILLTDAISLPSADYYTLCQKALAQCVKLQDRFLITDVQPNGKWDETKDIPTYLDDEVTTFRGASGIGINNLMYGAAYHPYLQTSLPYQYDEAGVTIIGLPNQTPSSKLANIKSTNTGLHNQIKAALAQQRVTLPPSPAIAGVYASVDRDRGVWKAPANVSLNSVIGPVLKITDDEQALLNVDPTAGKSINAIRAFTGKGTLVWGARTLAGNDNEWRYVPVRRLFITIEESIRKATAFAVFEPNDASTWLKVKAMIGSYLYGLWQQGALAGPKPDAAYFVHVGLGQTMTDQDILEGRMIVKIGVAAVRPAEFIVLQFTHKMQEA